MRKKVILVLFLICFVASYGFSFFAVHDMTNLLQNIKSFIAEKEQFIKQKLQWVDELRHMSEQAKQIERFWEDQVKDFTNIDWSNLGSLKDNMNSVLNKGISAGQTFDSMGDNLVDSGKKLYEKIKKVGDENNPIKTVKEQADIQKEIFEEFEKAMSNGNTGTEDFNNEVKKSMSAIVKNYENKIKEKEKDLADVKRDINEYYKAIFKYSSPLTLYEALADRRCCNIIKDDFVNTKWLDNKHIDSYTINGAQFYKVNVLSTGLNDRVNWIDNEFGTGKKVNLEKVFNDDLKQGKVYNYMAMKAIINQFRLNKLPKTNRWGILGGKSLEQYGIEMSAEDEKNMENIENAMDDLLESAYKSYDKASSDYKTSYRYLEESKAIQKKIEEAIKEYEDGIKEIKQFVKKTYGFDLE